MASVVESSVPSSARLGIGGPVGSGKTALIERLLPRLAERDFSVAVVTNDLVTKEDAKRLQKGGLIAPERVVGVDLQPAQGGDADGDRAPPVAKRVREAQLALALRRVLEQRHEALRGPAMFFFFPVLFFPFRSRGTPASPCEALRRPATVRQKYVLRTTVTYFLREFAR